MSQEPATTGDATELVFIYGDLRRGCSQAFRMEGAEYVRKGEVAGILLEISGRPALVPRLGPKIGWVNGDLFHVTPAHLAALDSPPEPGTETDGANYQRERIKVYHPVSSDFLGEAWVWQWTGSSSGVNVVRSGDWMDVARPRCAPWFTLVAAGCLLGFFPSLGFVAFNAIKPSPSLLDQVMVLLIPGIPLVGVIAAWWGLRRRESGEVLTVLVLVVSVILVILGVIALVAFLPGLIR